MNGMADALAECRICPRNCGVNRLEGEIGYCSGGALVNICSVGPHYGEEPELVGNGGSGTVFLGGCNLKCEFCQNSDISTAAPGRNMEPEGVAAVMMELEGRGCHNINFVTPTHFTPQLIEAVRIAKDRGLQVPIVWNTGGYETLETLRMLEGVVDIYMPDLKTFDAEVSGRLFLAADYPDVVRQAVSEMHRQVGDLTVRNVCSGGLSTVLAQRGLLVRHLVMPNGTSTSKAVLDWLAGLSKNTYVNVMPQYRPEHNAHRHPDINERLDPVEFRRIKAYGALLGL